MAEIKAMIERIYRDIGIEKQWRWNKLGESPGYSGQELIKIRKQKSEENMKCIRQTTAVYGLNEDEDKFWEQL